MSFLASRTGIFVRQIGRHTGINKLIWHTLIRPFRTPGSYEQALTDALLATPRPGDCVWDIGANVGHFTTKFCDIVGDKGRVFAFEPSPRNAEVLRAAVAGRPNATVIGAALSDAEGTAILAQGTDRLGSNSRLVASSEDAAGTQSFEVPIQTGDGLWKSGTVLIPNVVKLDVEGYELDVLRGMSGILLRRELRDIFIEVHFGLLERRGMATAPREIEALLRSSGFAVHWTDTGHMHGHRKN
jgi:FkbM family methyltransferase